MTKIAYLVLTAAALTVPASALQLSHRTATEMTGNRLQASDTQVGAQFLPRLWR